MTTQVLVPAAERPTRARLLSSAWRVLLGVAGLLTMLVVLALAGAARDDAAIDARTGLATAEVLDVTTSRTVVQFTGAGGQIYSPPEGLAYPAGLQVGQLVRVEYDTAYPDRVRVAGRNWLVGLPPATVTVVLTWALALPASWWLRLRPEQQ